MLYRNATTLCLLPPRKSFRWEAFHTIIIIALLVHIGIFLLVGQIIPSLPKSKAAVFEVDLIRKMKTKVINAPMANIDTDNNAGIGIRDREPAPPNRSIKDPGPVKPKPPEKEVPKLQKKAKAAPNKPLMINLPKPDYKSFDPNATAKVFRQPDETQKKGAPSGSADGIVESRGVNGDRKGEGSIPEEGGGQNGGDGIGNGRGGGNEYGNYPGGGGERGNRPYVFWEYYGFKPRSHASTDEQRRQRYFEMTDTLPYLSDAVVPAPHKLIGLGHGKVLVEIVIPGVDEIPSRGIHPENIRILEVESVIPESAEKMKEMALLSVKSSGWYPGKRDGKPVSEKITFSLIFYGSYEEK